MVVVVGTDKDRDVNAAAVVVLGEDTTAATVVIAMEELEGGDGRNWANNIHMAKVVLELTIYGKLSM